MPAESALPPVTPDPRPVTFGVFAGRTPDSRGRCGSLVMRPDEFHAFLDRLKPEAVRDGD